jgi:hypothetical protein
MDEVTRLRATERLSEQSGFASMTSLKDKTLGVK